MSDDFMDRLREAQANVERSEGMSGDFPEDPPDGIYIGTLSKLSANVSKSGRPQVQRGIIIVQGPESVIGLVARDFTSLERDFLIARLRAFVEAHPSYGWPRHIFDEAESKRTMDFVFHRDFIDTLTAIEADAPMYRFEFLHVSKSRANPDGFAQIKIIEVLDPVTAEKDEGRSAEIGTDVPTSDPPSLKDTNAALKRTVPASAEKVKEDNDDDDEEMIKIRLLATCQSAGITDVDEGMSIDKIVSAMNAYYFWESECSKEDLIEKGIDADPENSGFSSERLDWLISCGVDESSIIRKRRASRAKKTPPKRRK